MTKNILFGLALLMSVPAARVQAQPTDADARILQDVGLKTDGPALLDYFRQRTFKEPDAVELGTLIKQLASDSFAVRDKAHQDLLKLGPPAIAGLKQADNNPDTEVRVRVQDIRELIIAKVNPAVQMATARLIAAVKPDGAAEVLLGYIPFAPDQYVVDELCSAVSSVAMKDGKPDPAVVKCLTDPQPYKRIAAADALVHGKAKAQFPAVRKLLMDADDRVRMRAGLALAIAGEQEALPVLVDLLGSPRAEQLWQVEEILIRLAGADAPVVSLSNTEDGRKKCRDAWHDWLTKHEGKIDLTKLDQEQVMLGYTMVVRQTNRNVNGRFMTVREVVEFDAKHKERWKFEIPGNANPVDAFVIRQDRVLVAESNGRKITERDFQGQILWKQDLDGNPISVQGLPNEHVFVVMHDRLVEYDRDHKVVFKLDRPTFDIFRARKLRNGEVVFITNTGELRRIEPSKQATIKSFRVSPINMQFGVIDVLSDGGVLVPEYSQNKVVEYDADGKVRKEFSPIALPISVMRLPNGATLVAGYSPGLVVEFDRNGVQEQLLNNLGVVFSARRR